MIQLIDYFYKKLFKQEVLPFQGPSLLQAHIKPDKLNNIYLLIPVKTVDVIAKEIYNGAKGKISFEKAKEIATYLKK